MSDVEAAERRLEYAIARLESAFETRAKATTAAEVTPSQAKDGETLRDVSVRLDTVIGDLRRVLEE